MAPSAPSSLRSRLLLFAGATVVALGLAEAVLRIMPPLGPEFVLAATVGELNNNAFRDDTELRVVLAPSVKARGFRTNSFGIRGPAIGPKGANERRVLAVGDSFTLGMQVDDDETFPALLDAALGPNTRVYNAGVPGYGTEQATGLMKRLVPQIKADAVLLTVYSGNDLRDNARWAESPGMPTTPPPVTAPPPQRWGAVKMLGRNLRSVAYLLMYMDLQRQSEDFRIEEFRDEVAPFADRDTLNPLLPPTKAALQRFNDACRDLAVTCGVALVPPAYVVHPERRASTFEAFGLTYDERQIEEPGRAILSVVRQPTSSVDLTEALKTANDQQPYLVFDPHFSAAGHRIAARALVPMVTQLAGSP